MSESSSSGTSNLFVSVKEISVFADCDVTLSSPLTGEDSPKIREMTCKVSYIENKGIFYSSLKFTIFLYLSSYRALSTLLIIAVCRTRVTTNLVNMT